MKNFSLTTLGGLCAAAVPLTFLLSSCGGGNGNGPSNSNGPSNGGGATATPAVPANTPNATPGATSNPTRTAQPTVTAKPTATATTTTPPLPLPTTLPPLPVFFDGFLADNAGQPAQDFNGFFLWNVSGGTVDLVGGNVPGADPEALGGRFVDLDGGNSGRFATKSALVFSPGVSYRLTFLYKSTDGSSNSATVNLGNKRYTVSTRSRAFQTFSQTFSFPQATSANLIFQDASNDGAGIGIDTVNVLPLP